MIHEDLLLRRVRLFNLSIYSFSKTFFIKCFVCLLLVDVIQLLAVECRILNEYVMHDFMQFILCVYFNVKWHSFRISR